MPCLACSLPSLYLHVVSVVFGAAIPTSLYIFGISYLFMHFSLYNSTVTEKGWCLVNRAHLAIILSLRACMHGFLLALLHEPMICNMKAGCSSGWSSLHQAFYWCRTLLLHHGEVFYVPSSGHLYICNNKIEVQCLTVISSEGLHFIKSIYTSLLHHTCIYMYMYMYMWCVHPFPHMGMVSGKLFHMAK